MLAEGMPLQQKCERLLTLPRVAKQRDSQGDQEEKSLPNGRLSQESDLPRHHGCVEKMDYADPKLEVGA